MKVIKVSDINKKVYDSLDKLCFSYPDDVFNKMKAAALRETTQRATIAMNMLEQNAKIAKEEHIPLCQDTGMIIVFMHVGFGICFDGDVNKAINQAVRDGYKDNYLRKSVVDDPLFIRKNTTDNTPCIIYTDYVDSNNVELEIVAKGFGSENMSAISMLKPAQGEEGVKQFVINTVKNAGPNACPPMVVGVGIGGSFDYAALLAKKALTRDLESSNSNELYAKLEDELLEEINKLNIGPLGLKGKTTALKVNVEYYPTHIAGLPVAVNICCHASRHIKVVVE